MRPRSGAVVLAAVASALLVAGCGGSKEATTPASEWASSVCSAVSSWKTSLTTAVTSLQGGNLSENSLDQATDDVADATKTLGDDLKDAGQPDTQDGQEAKDLLDQLVADVDQGVQTIGGAMDGVSSGTGLFDAISQISESLAMMNRQVGDIVDQLQQLDPAGELKDALDNADSCSSLRSGG